MHNNRRLFKNLALIDPHLLKKSHGQAASQGLSLAHLIESFKALFLFHTYMIDSAKIKQEYAELKNTDLDEATYDFAIEKFWTSLQTKNHRKFIFIYAKDYDTTPYKCIS